MFPWRRSFGNLDPNDKFYLFNKTIKNILSDFIPHETITFDDRDPSWINSQNKHLINGKTATYKNCKNKISKKKKKQSIFCNVSVLSESTKFVNRHFELKNKYYSKVVKNILDPSTSPKTYCAIWKTFLSNKEIPVIPIIFHKNKFILKKKFKSKSFK